MPNYEKMPINNPHDRFFRSVFSEKEVALGYLTTFLPDTILSELDLSSLELENNSYINETLQEHFSDIVYRAQFKQNKEKKSQKKQNAIWLSFLFEHKSYPVEFIYLQLLQYIISVWIHLTKQKTQLRLVIPIVVYHGKEEWKLRKMEDYFYLPNKHFKQFLPIFDYILTDLSAISDARISQIRQNVKLFNTLMALKHSRNLRFVLDNLEIILANAEEYLEKQGGLNFFRTVIVYLSSTTNPKKSEFLKSVRQLNPKLKKNIMTLYEQFVQEGIQKGKIETLRQTTIRMIKKGANNEFIMDILDVNEDFINRIRRDLKNSSV